MIKFIFWLIVLILTTIGMGLVIALGLGKDFLLLGFVWIISFFMAILRIPDKE